MEEEGHWVGKAKAQRPRGWSPQPRGRRVVGYPRGAAESSGLDNPGSRLPCLQGAPTSSAETHQQPRHPPGPQAGSGAPAATPRPAWEALREETQASPRQAGRETGRPHELPGGGRDPGSPVTEPASQAWGQHGRSRGVTGRHQCLARGHPPWLTRFTRKNAHSRRRRLPRQLQPAGAGRGGRQTAAG